MHIEKPIKFVFLGRPKVQKNDLIIRKMKGGRPFVTHSDKCMQIRKAMSESFYEQYVAQGYTEPIDCLICIKLVFYCTKQWEPDLDNLPAIVLDALQGIEKKVKKVKTRTCVVLKDDKLVMWEQSEKIVMAKGDEQYANEEPRTECEITEYC